MDIKVKHDISVELTLDQIKQIIMDYLQNTTHHVFNSLEFYVRGEYEKDGFHIAPELKKVVARS